MALAILELIDADETNVWFKVDVGTNTRYQLKIGTGVRRDDGDEWVDNVYFSTPWQDADGATVPFGGSEDIRIPRKMFEQGKAYAQLYTSKAGGKSLAASEVVALPGLSFGLFTQNRSTAFSVPEAYAMTMPLGRPVTRRRTNHPAPLVRQSSIENILGEIIKVASPVVLDYLKSRGGAGTAADTPPGAKQGGGGDADHTAAPLDLLGQVLKSLLAAMAVPVGAAQPVSKPSSMAATMSVGNRFIPESGARYAKPFIFGIDDALIASLAGPVLQVLPQLINAANQKRIEMKKADNQLMGGILSDIQARLMMDKLLEAREAAKAQGPAAPITPEDITAIVTLLGQVPKAAAPPAASGGIIPPSASAQQSLPTPGPSPRELSNKAMLAFEFGAPIDWNGSPKVVFDRTRLIKLNPRLIIAEPAPKAPLPKAILKVVLYDGCNPETRLEKVFKLRNVLANTLIECAIDPAELAHFPPNVCYTVVAELRWKNPKKGTETRTLGSSEIVLINKSFIKAQGPELSGERELTDMARYRSFWNKIWEAPVLDATRGLKKYNWELDVTARYTSLLSSSHPSNGVLETKLLTESNDAESLSYVVRGRMKAGMELSVAEINKLVPLWENRPMLSSERLEAFAARPFLESVSREFTYNFKLKGRAGQAGMIWVVPVFKLFGFKLGELAATADNGQVTSTTEQDVQFPLPVAARLIGIKSAA